MSTAPQVVTVAQLLAYLKAHPDLWPLRKIAKRAKLSRAVVRNALTPGRSPTLRTVEKLVEATGGRLLVEIVGPNRLLD